MVRARAESTSADVADVGGDPESAHLVAGRGGGVGVPLPYGHPGPEGGQTPGDAAADSGSSTGDDGHPVVRSTDEGSMDMHHLPNKFDRRSDTGGRSGGEWVRMPRIEPIPMDELSEEPRRIIEEGVADGTYATPVPLQIFAYRTAQMLMTNTART